MLATQSDATKAPAAATEATTTAAPATDAATTGDDWMTSMVNSVTGCCGVFDKTAADKADDDKKAEATKEADAAATTADESKSGADPKA